MLRANIKTKLYFSLFAAFAVYSLMVYIYSVPSGTFPPMNEKAITGKIIWQKNNCISCHQLYGLGGYMGPDLTNSISARGTELSRVFIKYGSGSMPNFNLTDEEVEALIEYLTYVDGTGTSPVKNHSFTWYGSIKLNN